MGVTGSRWTPETRVFSVVDRPHRLVFAHTMDIAEWGRAVETEMTITFEDRDGKTLLTMVQTGFETRSRSRRLHDRLAGVPRDAGLRRVARAARDDTLKARHDTA